MLFKSIFPEFFIFTACPPQYDVFFSIYMILCSKSPVVIKRKDQA